MNIYHGLLFQNGHIADQKLAAELAKSNAAQDPTPTSAPGPAAIQRRRPGRLRWLIEEMALLGGRPVCPERHDDLDEPFPQIHRYP